MLVALNSIFTEQANSIEENAKAVTHLLNYSSTHSEAIKRYHTSGMILHIHSDASFLSDPGAKSRAGGYYYISMASEDPKKYPPKQPPLNVTIHFECTTTRNFLASAMGAELGAIFVNCQRGTPTCMELVETVHAQPPNPVVRDSATGDGFVNYNIHQRRSRSIDMYFYWSRERVRQGQFLVYWMSG